MHWVLVKEGKNNNSQGSGGFSQLFLWLFYPKNHVGNSYEIYILAYLFLRFCGPCIIVSEQFEHFHLIQVYCFVYI